VVKNQLKSILVDMWE